MPTLVLHHCQPVVIYGPYAPATVALALSFSGSGTVDITAAPNGIAPTGPAAAGTPYTGSAIDCTTISLHYRKAEGGPDAVSVQYAVT